MEELFRGGLPEHYEQLAYHYERSAAEEKAVEYLMKAGEKAKRLYLNEDAIGYFRRALDRLRRQGSGARGQGSGKVSLRDDSDPVGLSDPGPLTADPWSKATWRLEALRGLGEIYQGIGRHSEAEAQFRQAIALGQEMRLGLHELARLYFWLGDTLVWQRRAEEMIGPAEEMLALLGEETESVEAALMNEIAGIGYRWQGEREKAQEYIRRNARFLQRLPYSEELRSPYNSILMMYSQEEDNLEEATKWAQALEEKAREHHDLRALGGVLQFRSAVLQVRGDIRAAIAPLQQALEPYGKVGGVRHQ
jgi:tetratricopeptide (TPR) repeat protein